MTSISTEANLSQLPFRANETWGGILRSKDIIPEDCALYTAEANQHRYIESPLLDEVYSELTKGVAIGNRGKRDHRLATLCLLNACFEALDYDTEGNMAGVLWRTATSAAKVTRYTRKTFSPKRRRPAVDLLVDEGYVSFHKGGNDPYSFVPGRVSIVLPTDKLDSLYCRLRAEGKYLVHEFGAELQEVILLEKDGLESDYADTPFTIHQRELMVSMNKLNQSKEWSYTKQDGTKRTLSASALVLKRQFKNDSFDSYGRIHCPAQNYSKRERKTLLIDGEQTVEQDFRGMSPTLAYVLAGREAGDKPLELDGDPYNMSPYTRSQVKLAFQVCMNTDSRRKALQAVSSHVQGVDAGGLINAVERHHWQISGLFYRGIWMSTLTILESDIMQQILQHCNGFSIPALPIHDSIVCKKSDGEMVQKFMKRRFEEKCGVSPEIVSSS